MDKLWYLRRLDLFEGLSDAEMRRLGDLMRDRVCHVGEDVVVRPSGDRIYLLKHGRVEVLSGGVAVATLGPGQLFGTSAFFGAADPGQRVVAVEEVVVCEAPAGQFLAAMATHPRLAARLLKLMSRQIFELEQTVERTATDTVAQRLADLLLRVARRDGQRMEVRGLAQADLARMIGASRESVSRLIASWERLGMLKAGPRRIEILDEERLAGLARDRA
ncbi:MAG: Crp/Fnr family transcriptional regulator [Chloroflexi bacterium]|nr:Crp/Fnr family transcriptional regulator [Chloroflexota bacterium]MBI2983451.1 Crp/Fnr family transcriptional regulator [Chloroflexota bacterium]